MSLRTYLRDHVVRVRLGATALILANLFNWFVHPPGGWQREVTDGLTGLFFGVAIAFLLLSLRSRRAGCAPGAD